MRQGVLYFRSFQGAFFAVGMAVLAALQAPGANAQVDDQPVIIIPPEPTKTVDVKATMMALGTQPFTYFSNQLDDNIQNLQTNLTMLAALNTADHRAMLNDLGKNYGGAPSLGDDMGAAISGINVRQVTDDTDALNDQMKGMMTNYLDAMISIKDLPKAQKRSVMQNLGGTLTGVSRLNSSIGTMNSDLSSLIKTYRNLLDLSNKPSSELANMKGLTPALGGLDSLATGQLKNLSSLNTSFGKASQDLDSFKNSGGLKVIAKQDKDGAAANSALGAFNKSLTAISVQSAGANSGMTATLKSGAVSQSSAAAPVNKNTSGSNSGG